MTSEWRVGNYLSDSLKLTQNTVLGDASRTPSRTVFSYERGSVAVHSKRF
jgi:hypothetical protein